MRHFYNVMLRVKQVLVTLFSNQKSIRLNGTSQYLTVTDDSSLQPSSITLSAWVRASVNDASYDSIIARNESGGQHGYIVQTEATTGKVRFIIYDGSGSSVRLSTSNVRDGKWHHVCCTYNGVDRNGVLIYVDGVLDQGSAGATISGGIGYSTTTSLYIGNQPQSSQPFPGDIDQVSVWNDDLTAQEVKELTVLRDISQHSQYATKCISWWEFDDDDVSGSTVSDRTGSNDATMVASPSRTTCIPFPYSYQLNAATASFENITPFTDGSTSTLTPYGGFAWDFDGSNDYIDFGDVNILDGLSAFSFSSWINPSSNFTAGSETIIGKDASGQRVAYLAGFSSSGNKIRFLVSDDGTTNDALNSTTNLPLNTVYHVVGTWDGSTMKIYINGAEDGSQSTTNATGTLPNTTANLSIGRTDFGSYFAGKIGDTIVFDKALSAAEVSAVYNGHEPRDESLESLSGNIVGYWRAYDSSNTASGVTDHSSNSNDGTMTNMSDDDFVYNYARESYDADNLGSFDFDGGNEHVTMGDTTVTDGLSELTASIWFNSHSNFTTSGQRLISKDGSGQRVFSLGGYRSAGTNRLFAAFSDNGSSADTLIDTAFTDLNRWHLATVTWDGSTIQLYLDGEPTNSTASSGNSNGTLPNTTSDLIIGGSSYAGSTYFDGYLSHGALWDSALTHCEIQEIYNDGSPTDLSQHTASANLIGWWKMDASDDPTGTVTDASSNSNNGTATNMESGDLVTGTNNFATN